MGKLVCEICGGSLMMNVDNIAECESCGMKYSKEKVVQMVKIDGAVEITKGEAEKERLLKNAYTYSKLNKHKEAEEIYVKITQEFPDDWRGWFGLGKMYFTQYNADIKYEEGHVSAKRHIQRVEYAENQYKTAMRMADEKTVLEIEEALNKEKNNTEGIYIDKWQDFLEKVKNAKDTDDWNGLYGRFETLKVGPDFCVEFHKNAIGLANKIKEYLSQNRNNATNQRAITNNINEKFTNKCVYKCVGRYSFFGETNINLNRLYAVYDDIFIEYLSGGDYGVSELRIFKSNYVFTNDNYKQIIDSLKIKRKWLVF